mgnify:CR=1 FL=1
MKQKLENFAVSYIEAIAAKRNRNVEWAKSAVRESASIPVDKALELKVIEIIAKDLSDLQQQLDGRVVEGKELKTAGAEVVEIAMSASETDLSIAVAARGDVRPDACGNLRNHWRTQHLWAVVAVEFQQMDAKPTEHTVVECNGLKSATLNST